MKKLILLFVSTLILTSCNVDDDGPKTLLTPAEVSEIDVPDYFENGKTYEIDIVYLLPDACHNAAGINVQRGSNSNGEKEWRDIYVTGVASYDSNLSECNKDATNTELEKDGSFKITIPMNDEQSYTFYLWTGVDTDNKNIYTEVVVPIGKPEDAAQAFWSN